MQRWEGEPESDGEQLHGTSSSDPNYLPVVTELEVDHHQEGVEAEAKAGEEIDPEALREPAQREVL